MATLQKIRSKGPLFKNNKQKNNNFKWQLYKKFEAKDLCWSS